MTGTLFGTILSTARLILGVAQYNGLDLLGSTTQGSSKVYLYNANNATNSFTNELFFDETYDFDGITEAGDGTIKMNGQYLAVSVPTHNFPTVNGQVIFYAYISDNDTWVYLSTYTAGNDDYLGIEMTMGVDVLVAVSYSYSLNVFRVNTSQASTAWVLDDTIVCPNSVQSLAIDGDTLAVGSDSGVVFMYQYLATMKNWSLSQTLYTNNTYYHLTARH